ncbi:MAG: TfoX/Sxy family DNA transformation protein [Pseudomonadota bacterium]
MTNELTSLNGLGPRSTYLLKSIGIHNKEDLFDYGAIHVYMKLKSQYKNISLNFLYGMLAALEDKHWREIAATRREELLMQIEAYKTLEAQPRKRRSANTNQGTT